MTKAILTNKITVTYSFNVAMKICLAIILFIFQYILTVKNVISSYIFYIAMYSVA